MQFGHATTDTRVLHPIVLVLALCCGLLSGVTAHGPEADKQSQWLAMDSLNDCITHRANDLRSSGAGDDEPNPVVSAPYPITPVFLRSNGKITLTPSDQTASPHHKRQAPRAPPIFSSALKNTTV